MDEYIPMVEKYGSLVATTILHNHSAVTVWKNTETGFVFYDNGKQLLPDECSVIRVEAGRDHMTSVSKKVEEIINAKKQKNG